MGVLAHQGIRVPEEISVIGWDDSEAASAPTVDLTSVVQDTGAMALAAVARAVARIEGHAVEDREIVLQPDLQVRKSTQRLAENILRSCLDIRTFSGIAYRSSRAV